MRKYIQLLLVVTAVVAVSLMLLYERKYSKMKIILEILNGFNYKETTTLKPPQLSSQPTPESHFIPNPSWIHLTDSLYLYSAIWQNTSKEDSILILATSVSTPDTDSLGCYLWYANHPQALAGKVKVMKYTSDSSAFVISCSPIDTSIVPFGITISYKLINSSFIPVTTLGKRYKMAVCLETLPVAFQDAIPLSEFLIFHQHAGIDSFVIYERGLSPVVRRLLESAKQLGYQIDILQWNYPAQEAGKDAQIIDCLARSFLVHRVTNVAVLKLDQFLVPKNLKNLTDAIGRVEGASNYKFNTYNFCSEYPIDVVAETLDFPFNSLKYTKRLNKNLNSDVLVYRNNMAISWNYQQNKDKAYLVPASDVVLHIYGKCHLSTHQLISEYIDDITMMHYKNIFFLSPLYRYLEK